MDNEKELLLEGKGIEIFDHIQELATDENSARRWVWELLQNAVDITYDDDEGVSVKYECLSDKVSFYHNGLTFDEKSLNHLFFKISGKRNQKPDEISIGKYGTGFLTTHLLSKVVVISGLYQKKDTFHAKIEEMRLDRSGDEKNITTALKDYSNDRNLLEQKQPVPYNHEDIENTVFTYLMEENTGGAETAPKGLSDLQKAMIFAIHFISDFKPLKEVLVKNDVKNEH